MGGGGGGGVRPAFQNPYNVYDHSTIFPTLFTPCPKFDSLFMIVAEGRVSLITIYKGLFVEGQIDNVEIVPNRPHSILQCSNMAPRLSGETSVYLLLFSSYPSLFYELRDKRNLKKLQFRLESLRAMLEY